MSGDGESGVEAALSKLGKGGSIDRALGKERAVPSGVTRRRARAVELAEDSDESEVETAEEEGPKQNDPPARAVGDDEAPPVVEEASPMEMPKDASKDARRHADSERYTGAEPPVVRDDKRSLAYVNDKYQVGTSNGAVWRIFRKFPQMSRAPDGTMFKCDGFLGSTDIAIDEEWLQANHGGGRFDCRLNTPDPNTGSPRQRTALTIEIGGQPLQPVTRDGGMQMLTAPITQTAPAPVAESPSVVAKAFEMLGGVAERSERRAEARVGERDGQLDMVRQMAEDKTRELVASKDRELQQLRDYYERQLTEKDTRLSEKERQIEALRGQVDNLRARDPIEDVSKLKNAGLLGDGGAAHQELVRAMQASHSSEMSRMRESHRDEMSMLRTSNEAERASLREAHARELTVLREAHQRTIDSNDESWKARLARADELLAHERENTRRLSEQHSAEKKELDERHRTRLADEKETWKAVAESRYDLMVTQKDLRIETQKEEIDRLKGELHTAQSKNVESGDALSQLTRAKSLVEAMKEATGVGGREVAQPPPTTLDKLVEFSMSPMGQGLVDSIMRGFQQPQPVAAAPGPVVVTERHAPQRQQLPGPMAPPAFVPPPPPPDLDQVIAADHAREAARDRVNRPPQQPAQQQPAQQQPAQQQPAQQAAEQNVAIPPQAIPLFVQQLEMAIADGDTPEEFAEEVRRQVPAAMLAALLRQMSATDLQRQIDQQFPDSQIASKAGHDFVTKVFKVLGGHL